MKGWTPGGECRFRNMPAEGSGVKSVNSLPSICVQVRVPLLCSTTQLDRAIERLDPVIVRFPALISARHARGTAHLRKWLNSAPIQVQQLRSGPLTYSSRFIPGVNGIAPLADTLALQRARRDFAAILKREMLPRTLANLAVLEAYAGCLPPAVQRIEQAHRLAPDDAGVLNQRGVIHFLAGDLARAAESTERAARLVDASSTWVLFNRAKCAAVLGDPVAPSLLRKYLERDDMTDWRREAQALLGESPEVAGRMSREAPPVFPGLGLGTGYLQVTQRFGPPSREERWRGLLLWSYESLGLELVLCPNRGAIHLDLRLPRMGAIEGVQVGDPVRSAFDQWGSPVESGEGQLVFWTGAWGVGLEHDDRLAIVTLSLGGLR